MSNRLAAVLIAYFQVADRTEALIPLIRRLSVESVRALYGELRGVDFQATERFSDGLLQFFLPARIRACVSLDNYFRVRDELFAEVVLPLWDELYAETFMAK